jgi:lipopolysaccharide/colanic/teichoic acid biosynthesis glycosyltransferase
MKRAFDIFFSCVGLLLSLPVFLVLVCCVRMRLGSPVFFTQERPGKAGLPFKLIKFRTMRDAVDDHGELLPDAERLTDFGLWLRRTSLDELPELWNVLRGDMSLVGPRPLLMEYLPLYSEFESRRHEVKPGITGWAQVNGRNSIAWSEKFRLDVWYVDNQSLFLDVKILLLTIKKVLLREGINSQGVATMPKFRGHS